MQHDIRATLVELGTAPIIEGPLRLRSSVGQPSSDDEIEAAWAGRSVSPSARKLWLATRSAELFRDIDYGQWGLRLLDPATSRSRTDEERRRRPRDFEPDDVVAGEFLGDSDLLVISGDGSMLVALPLDPRPVWYRAASDVSEFLQRYRAANGEKYWEAPLT